MTRNEEYLKTIMDALGGDSTKIPPYTINSEDDLKYIAAALAERAANKGKFLVTLTPTAEDFSGTMDKTVAEINTAYEAGQEIVFSMTALGFTAEMQIDVVAKQDGVTYPSFESKFMGDNGGFFRFYTGATDDGTRTTYGTEIYALTPAS